MRNQNVVGFMLGGFVALNLSSCFTPAKERALRDEIFNLQTRVMDLEKDKHPESKTRKNIASAQADLERTNMDVQRLKGEVDALKEGMITGEVPGQDPARGSIAAMIKALNERLEKIELAQADLAAKLNGAGGAPKVKGDSAPMADGTSPGVQTLREVREAYVAKKYRVVIASAPQVLAKLRSPKAKGDLLFMAAESYFKTEDYREAALKFNDFVENDPKDSRVPDAKLKMGDAFKQLGDAATAKIYFSEVATRYKTSSAAREAKQRLKEMGVEVEASRNTPKSAIKRLSNKEKTPNKKGG